MASLENRGNGSWRITVSSGYNPDGSKRRLQRTVKVDPNKTENAQRKEVEKLAAAIETDYRRHLITDGKKVTMEALAAEFMSAHVERRGLSAATSAHYKFLIEGRILPEFGKIAVQDLSPRDITRFYSKLEKAPALTKRSKNGGLSGNTVLHYHRCLHAMLTYAVRAGYKAQLRSALGRKSAHLLEHIRQRREQHLLFGVSLQKFDWCHTITSYNIIPFRPDAFSSISIIP